MPTQSGINQGNTARKDNQYGSNQGSQTNREPSKDSTKVSDKSQNERSASSQDARMKNQH